MGVLRHELFEFAYVIGDALVTQEAAAVLGNQYVVFNADATKVLVGFQLVEAEKILAVTAGLPLVDEGRDEVDARLVGNHETFFQLTTHAQTVSTKLFQVGACLVVETYIDLA